MRAAVEAGRPVVALESVIFSAAGLPVPANRRCYRRVTAALRSSGALPALTGVLDGRAVLGAAGSDASRLLEGTVKLGARDLGPAVAAGLKVGVTTVSASVALAAAAGVEVLATGGIGGAHRGASATGDVSHDLVALARHPVVVVSSGVKAFLDIPRTLECLETLGVAVVGWKTDRFPAFYVRDSGSTAPWTAHSAGEAAAAFRAAAGLGLGAGMLVANPIPASAELNPALVGGAVEEALAASAGRTGPAVTPLVLDALAEATGGATVEANVALAEANASVAAEVAVALTRGPATTEGNSRRERRLGVPGVCRRGGRRDDGRELSP